MDLSATDGLSEADRSAVASHDSDVVRARKKAALAAAEARRDELTALLNRARRIQALLAESMERNMAYCQNHFREQALSHLRWSHKRAGLNRPYMLPGVLEKLPDIELSELAELADEGSAGDADVGAGKRADEGVGKLGSAGDAADVAVAVADAAAGAGVSVDAREEGVR